MWISVKDRMPNPGQEVLCYLPSVVELTIYFGDQFDEPWDSMNGDDITHWMPIPDYPEDV